MSNPDTVSTEYRIPADAPNLILRAIWFVLIGWWLTGVLSAAAWALNATIIGLPLGLWIINRLPFAATLHPVERFSIVENGVVLFLLGRFDSSIDRRFQALHPGGMFVPVCHVTPFFTPRRMAFSCRAAWSRWTTISGQLRKCW